VVARAHWLESQADFTSFTGAAFPTMDVTIPALATVQRVIFSIACAGVQSSAATNDYRQVQGVYLLNKIVIDYPGRPLHTLHDEKLIVPASTHALFDASLLTGGVTNRFFYALYQGGDRIQWLFRVDPVRPIQGRIHNVRGREFRRRAETQGPLLLDTVNLRSVGSDLHSQRFTLRTSPAHNSIPITECRPEPTP
jgi:hypothetical protein